MMCFPSLKKARKRTTRRTLVGMCSVNNVLVDIGINEHQEQRMYILMLLSSIRYYCIFINYIYLTSIDHSIGPSPTRSSWLRCDVSTRNLTFKGEAYFFQRAKLPKLEAFNTTQTDCVKHTDVRYVATNGSSPPAGPGARSVLAAMPHLFPERRLVGRMITSSLRMVETRRAMRTGDFTSDFTHH